MSNIFTLLLSNLPTIWAAIRDIMAAVETYTSLMAKAHAGVDITPTDVQTATDAMNDAYAKFQAAVAENNAQLLSTVAAQAAVGTDDGATVAAAASAPPAADTGAAS